MYTAMRIHVHSVLLVSSCCVHIRTCIITFPSCFYTNIIIRIHIKDAFQSILDPPAAAAMHGASRALSGGPVYTR